MAGDEYATAMSMMSNSSRILTASVAFGSTWILFLALAGCTSSIQSASQTISQPSAQTSVGKGVLDVKPALKKGATDYDATFGKPQKTEKNELKNAKVTLVVRHYSSPNWAKNGVREVVVTPAYRANGWSAGFSIVVKFDKTVTDFKKALELVGLPAAGANLVTGQKDQAQQVNGLNVPGVSTAQFSADGQPTTGGLFVSWALKTGDVQTPQLFISQPDEGIW